MDPTPVRFKVAATAVLSTTLLVVGIMNLRARAAWIDPWDGVFWEESAAGLRAAEVAADGPGARAGVAAGDRLEAINGRAIANLGDYFTLLDDIGIQGAATYRVDRAGSGPVELSVPIAGRRLLSARDLIRVLLAFLHLGIGLFVALRGGRSPRAFHFYLICVAAFVVYLYHYTPRLEAFDLLVYWLSVAAFLLLPALFLHFCLRFPLDLVRGESRAALLYIPVVALGFFRLLWMAGRLANLGLPRTAAASQIIDRFDLIYFSAGFVVGALVLWRRMAEARDFTVRQQMKWVSYGTLAGIVPFTLIYVVPVLAGARPGIAIESAMLFLALIPLSFGYAIIQYRLLDVEIIVRRGAAYFIASSVLLAGYLLFVLVLARGLGWVAPEAGFIGITAAALAIALLFAPIRSRIQARLDRFFYKDQFEDRASLLDFARMLTTEISLGRLSRRILERVSKTFGIETAALFLVDPVHPGSYRLTDEVGLDVSGEDAPIVLREDELVAGTAVGLPSIGSAGRLRRASPELQRQGLHYLHDLELRGRRIGMIGLGDLRPGRHFSSEDLDLLDALSGYAAMALENANLYRSVEIKALELERLKVYTENIIESINVAVLVLDLDGKITSCNRAFEELYGARRREIQALPVTGLFSGDVVASLRRATGTESWEMREASHIHKLYLDTRSGNSIIVNLSVVPMIDADGSTTGCILVLDDVTQKIRLENQLLQSEKLSSIGLLAAGIAHEVNTPITGISSFTQMLLKETPPGDGRRPVLEKIEKQTFRAAEIVNGLLNFARLNGSEYKDLDVNQVISESLTLVEHQLKQNRIEIDRKLDGTVPSVYGNGGKLQQVFMNLFLNARDAMPSGGKLEISTSMNEKMVIVDIYDTGVGISEENIKRIYDPFFTTKSTGKGTGLGLAVTYGIIQEHGGRIFVDSSPGEGTHFRLKLPTRQAR